MQTRFAKISEWIKAGNMASGLCHIFAAEVKETAKAFGIPCKRVNEFGNLKPAICWLPKSQAWTVEDDFYAHKSPVNLMVPEWLFSAKTNEGFEF